MSWWFEKTADSVNAAVQAVMTDKNIPIPVSLFTCEVIKGCGKVPTWPATLYVKSTGHIGDPVHDHKYGQTSTCAAQIEARWIARSVLPETVQGGTGGGLAPGNVVVAEQETATTAAA